MIDMSESSQCELLHDFTGMTATSLDSDLDLEIDTELDLNLSLEDIDFNNPMDDLSLDFAFGNLNNRQDIVSEAEKAYYEKIYDQAREEYLASVKNAKKNAFSTKKPIPVSRFYKSSK